MVLSLLHYISVSIAVFTLTLYLLLSWARCWACVPVMLQAFRSWAITSIPNRFWGASKPFSANSIGIKSQDVTYWVHDGHMTAWWDVGGV